MKNFLFRSKSMSVIILLISFILFSVVHGGENIELDDSENPVLIIDCRSPAEFKAGHLDGAINIPHSQIVTQISKFAKNKEQVIILYCRSGARSNFAQKHLSSLGYRHVYNFGGIDQARSKLAKH